MAIAFSPISHACRPASRVSRLQSRTSRHSVRVRVRGPSIDVTGDRRRFGGAEFSTLSQLIFFYDNAEIPQVVPNGLMVGYR